MWSRRSGRLPTGQTTRDIIIYFIDNGILSQNFLYDYDKLMQYYLHESTSFQVCRGAGFSSALDNARDLLMRLDSISYANEKMIHELSSNFERVMMRSLGGLKAAGVGDELIGTMIRKIQAHLEELSTKEVQNLIAEHKKTT